MGFDDGGKSLGGRETGAQAALPIWLEYMKKATEGRADEAFAVPHGIVCEKIDPDSGLLAPPGFAGAISECFLPGTAPTQVATGAGEVKPEDFFRYDLEEGQSLPSPGRLP